MIYYSNLVIFKSLIIKHKMPKGFLRETNWVKSQAFSIQSFFNFFMRFLSSLEISLRDGKLGIYS